MTRTSEAGDRARPMNRGWIHRRLDVLARAFRYHGEMEASLHRVARTLSGAVSVQEVAEQAAGDAVRTTRAAGAYVECTRHGIVDVIAAAGDGTPPAGTLIAYDDSLTAKTLGAAEAAIRLKPEVIGRSM